MLGWVIPITIYLLTVFIGYCGVRKEFIVKNEEPNGLYTMAIFIPLVNVFLGVVAWVDATDMSKLKRFYRMK